MAAVLIPEVRYGRNFLRAGDPIKVKPPRKTQFRSGWTFKGFDPKANLAVVIDPVTRFERWVALDSIKRVSVTKGGVRKETR